MNPSDRPLQRDRPPTAFSRILDTLLLRHPKMRAAVFVDAGGECIDYCSTLEPFEAQVRGATWLLTHSAILERGHRLGHGAVRLWTVETDREAVLVRGVTDEHVLVLLLEQDGVTAHVLQDLSEVAHRLRMEAGYTSERWEVASDPWLGRDR